MRRTAAFATSPSSPAVKMISGVANLATSGHTNVLSATTTTSAAIAAPTPSTEIPGKIQIVNARLAMLTRSEAMIRRTSLFD
jgi:hypothetical protein